MTATELKNSEENASRSPASRALESERAAAAGHAPNTESSDRVGKGFTGNDAGDSTSNDTVGKGFTGSAAASPELATAQRFVQIFWGSRKRQRNTIIGTIIGVILAAFGIYSTFGISGFEFIQMAKVIENAHLSHDEDVANGRVGKLYAYLRSGGDIGDTRLNFLERKYKNTMLQQLDEAGFKPNYDGRTTFNGFTVDKTGKSPFRGMKDADIKAQLADEGITDKVVTFSTQDGNLIVTAKGGFLNGYFKKTILNKFLVKQMNESFIPNVIRDRIMAKYGAIDWHPLTPIKGAINSKVNAAALKAWEKARNIRLTTGEDTTNLDTSKSGLKDKNGKVIQTPGEAGAVDSSKVNDILTSLKDSKGVKITGGVAAAIGILCIAYTIDHNYGLIHYVQYVAPAMRLAGDVLTIASQIQNGTDVNTQEMGAVEKQFTNDLGQTWSGAITMAADLGMPGGQDLNQDQKDAFRTTPPGWLNWINSIPGIGALCSTVGSIVVGTISVVIGILSQETATTVIGAVLSYLAAPHIISYLSNLVAGNTINILAVAGPAFGNVINYGARFLGSVMSMFNGGVVMSSSEEAQINQTQTSSDMQQFRSQSLAHRLFSPTDYHSLLARIIITQSPSFSENISHTASSLLGVGHYFASIPINMLSGAAFAAPVASYQYGTPMISWSVNDANNPYIQDPYGNADIVGSMLDHNGQGGEPDYIHLVAQCFNDTISKAPASDGRSYWSVAEGASDDPNSLNYTDPNTYNATECKHPKGVSQTNWLRVRAFVLDSSQMDGYACEHGDNTSCANSGFTSVQ